VNALNRLAAAVRVATVAGATLALTSLAACGGDDGTTLDILAASSLSGSFEELAGTYAAEHSGVRVRLSLGSSTALAQQVTEGAPADVLATADLESMDLAGDDVGSPTEFATNTLVLVTPPDNPAGVESLEDLVEAQFVSCVESAPCGALTDQLLERNQSSAEPVSREADVKAVLAKVTSGEVDAGFVYVTDAVAAADAVATVEIPGAADLPNRYAVATVSASENDELAQDWVDLVTGTEGQQTLDDAGFGPPATG